MKLVSFQQSQADVSSRLQVQRQHLSDINDHLIAAYPNEGCGLLVGERDAEGWIVVSVALVPNISDRAVAQFEVDPKVLLRTERLADERGQAIVGVVHSHPDCAAIPSMTDVQYARVWDNTAWMIVRIDGGETISHRTWAMSNGVFREARIEIV